jgi:hypothetical protein
MQNKGIFVDRWECVLRRLGETDPDELKAAIAEAVHQAAEERALDGLSHWVAAIAGAAAGAGGAYVMRRLRNPQTKEDVFKAVKTIEASFRDHEEQRGGSKLLWSKVAPHSPRPEGDVQRLLLAYVEKY